MASRGIAKAILHEPLVHFLIVGGLIFAGYQWTGAGRDASDTSIEIDADEIRQLALTWAGTRQRPPTKAEMDGLIEDRIREEILYREALRLGLDRDDIIIRRRMATKMDYLAEQQVEADPPNDAQLQNYMKANGAKYGGDQAYDFEHIYLGQERDADAQDLAQKLNDDEVQPGDVAVRIPLPKTFANAKRDEITRRFGREFTAGLDEMKIGVWSGPAMSGFGQHMVRITAREQIAPPDLQEVKRQVLNDWRAEKIAKQRAENYAELRRQYDIEIVPFQ